MSESWCAIAEKMPGNVSGKMSEFQLKEDLNYFCLTYSYSHPGSVTSSIDFRIFTDTVEAEPNPQPKTKIPTCAGKLSTVGLQ